MRESRSFSHEEKNHGHALLRSHRRAARRRGDAFAGPPAPEILDDERHDVRDAPDAMIPIVRAPEDITVIVVGGAGKHSSWQPTFGDGTKPTRRVIARRDGTPVQRITDLKR